MLLNLAPRASRRVTLILTLAAAITALVLVARAVRKDEGVIVRNRIFAERLLAGEDPYLGGLHAPYPLAWGLFHAALSWMPLPLERAIWALMQIAALTAVMVMLVRMLRPSAPALDGKWSWVALAALVFTARYWIRDTAGGGANLILLALVLGGLYLHTRKQTIVGAALLATACALKLTALIFLPYLVWRRQWRLVTWSSLFFTIALLLPMLVMGPASYFEISYRWGANVLGFLGKSDLASSAPDVIAWEWMNQSLRNALFRFLTDLDHPSSYYFDFLKLDHTTATMIVRAVFLMLLAWVAWVTGSDASAADGENAANRNAPSALAERPARFLAEIALVLCLMLLFSPITWRAHHVAVLPAATLLIVQAASTSRGRRGTIALLVLAFILGAGMSETIWGKDGKDLLQAHYTVTFSCMLLMLGVARVLRGAAPIGAISERSDLPA